MTTSPKVLEELDYTWNQLRPRWEDFHERRGQEGPWLNLKRRKSPVTLQHELKGIQEGIDFQSPILEWATNMFKSILKQNPTTIDLRVPGYSQQSRDVERDLSLYWRKGWDLLNKHRVWDDRVGEGQVVLGAAMERLCYKEFEPPEDGEDLDFPFRWESCLIDGLYFNGGIFDPQSTCWYRYSTPVINSGVKDSKGRRPIITAGKVDWLGPHEPYDYKESGTSQLHVIVKDAPTDEKCPLKGCDHYVRKITTYVCPVDGNMENAEHVETVTSPFPGSSFFVIGGYVFQTERNPDLVYRPVLLPLYELILFRNYLVTLLAVLVRAEAKRNDYGTTASTNPDVLAQTYQAEGGAKSSVDIPDPADDKMPVYPFDIKRFPTITSANLMPLINKVDEEIERYLPNPSLLGLNFVQQSNATASAVGMGTQAAGLSLEPLLSESDGVIETSITYMTHAQLYWSYYSPDNSKPHWVVTVPSDDKRGKAGERIFVDEKKLSVIPEITVTTGSKTPQQKQQDWALAKDKFGQGVMTVRDLIRESGVMDPEYYMELLYADQLEETMMPMELTLSKRYLERQASLESGIDYGAMDPEQTGQVPASAAQAGAAASTAPHNPNPTAGAAMRSLNPTVSLPGVDSPTGGSSGVA